MQQRYSDDEVNAAGLLEETLQCQWLDETTGQWQPVTSQVDVANNILTCQADHFTEFAITGAAQPTRPEGQNHRLFLPVAVK